jgi:hypothetical protein
MRARVTRPSIGSVLFGHDLRRAVRSNGQPPTNRLMSWPILVTQIYRPRPTTRPGVRGRALREEKDMGQSFGLVFIIYSEENVFSFCFLK